MSLETRRSTLYGEARETLRNLRDDLTIEQAEGLRIKKAERVRIQELSVQYERLITRIDDMRNIIPELIREIDRFDTDLKGLNRPQPVEPLQQAVAAAAEVAPLERQTRSERADIQSAIKTIEKEKHGLGLGETALAELAQLPIPSMETIHVFESRFDGVEKRRAETAADIDKTRRSLSQAARQIEAHSLAQDVPTEVDLQDARKWRDHGWRIISRILEGKAVSDTELQNYLKKWPEARHLADAFETSLRQTDALSDRLRREAGRVATKAQLLAEQTAGNEQLRQMASDLDTIEREHRRILHEWNDLWAPTGISPRTPREMARWTQAVQTLIEKAKDTDSRRIKTAAFQRDIDEHRKKLLQSLGMLEVSPKAEGTALNPLIKKALAIIDHEAKKGQRREQLERDRSLKAKELAAVQSRLRTHEQDLKQWQSQWEQAVSPLGLAARALPVEAAAVMEELKRLFDRLKEAQILQKRIDGIDRDDREFQRKVKGIVDVVATDLAGRPADEAALELHYRLKRSRDALSRKETLITQLEGERTRFEKAEADILQIETQLREMCREAGCDHIDQIPEAERRSNRKRRIETDLAAVDDHLRRLSGGAHGRRVCHGCIDRGSGRHFRSNRAPANGHRSVVYGKIRTRSNHRQRTQRVE